jgi:hypothetical protein
MLDIGQGQNDIQNVQKPDKVVTQFYVPCTVMALVENVFYLIIWVKKEESKKPFPTTTLSQSPQLSCEF